MIYSEHGIRGFYHGFSAQLLRDAPGTALYFSLYECFKYVSRDDTPGAQANMWTHLVGGGIAGTASWMILFPIDLCKSIIQRDALQPSPKYVHLSHVFKERYLQGGLFGFYRGITPQLIRSFPVHAINFLGIDLTDFIVLEQVLTALRLDSSQL